MTAPNGRANGSAMENVSDQVVQTIVPLASMRSSIGQQFSPDQIKELIVELEVPFDPAVIEWRVTNTTKSRKLPWAEVRQSNQHWVFPLSFSLQISIEPCQCALYRIDAVLTLGESMPLLGIITRIYDLAVLLELIDYLLRLFLGNTRIVVALQH